MRKVIVSGASGVIGNAVLERLDCDEDSQIVALTRNAGNAVSGKSVEWKETDYSLDDLTAAFSGASAIIHLAGVKGDKTDLRDFDSDIRMTENILDASVRCGVRKMVYSSSRLVYVNPDNIPWTEDTPPEPQSAYAINKLRTEKLCQRYCEEFGISVTVARIAQVLSEKDTMRNMVNVFRDMSQRGEPLTVTGKSIAKRQYVYVRDLAEVLYRLYKLTGRGFEIVNVGMKEAYTNYEIALAFKKAYKNRAPINYNDSTPETITPSVMDVSRMIEMTGYVPMNLEDALNDMASRTDS